MYDVFGYPLEPRSKLLKLASDLMDDYEAGRMTQNMVECTLYNNVAHYCSEPEEAIDLYKEMVVICFPANGVEKQLMAMARAGKGKIALIKHLRDFNRENGLEPTGLRECKERVEYLFPDLNALT